jgi:hyaluronoglucosaminidase
MSSRLGLLLAAALAGCGGASASAPTLPAHAEAVDALTLYPTPQFQRQDGLAVRVVKVCVNTGALPRPDVLADVAPELVAQVRLELAAPGAACDWPITFETAPPADLDADAAAAWAATAGSDERYLVQSRIDGSQASAELFAESDRGAAHALAALFGLVDAQQRVHVGTIVDAPAIATRGIVEGFYGTPFSQDQRTCLMRAMVRLRQNIYLYGPKDDPYARTQWADPYPPDAAKAIADGAAAAKARLIDFYWSVSPGAATGGDPTTSISFASPADFARLTHKIDTVRALGVSRFALFIDDTDGGLFYGPDQQMFPTDAAAHADLANRLEDYVTASDPSAHILFVGRIYANQFNGWDYVTTLGQTLRPGVDVMWTGAHVFSTTMSASDMTKVNGLLGRKVVIWDNSPTDTAALFGRTADLAQGVSAFLSNPMLMEEHHPFDDFWSVFGTLGDYQWNTAAYDPSASWATWNAIRGDCD